MDVRLNLKTRYAGMDGEISWAIHAIGVLKPFQYRPELNIVSFGVVPRDYLLAYDFIPEDIRRLIVAWWIKLLMACNTALIARVN